MIDKTNPATPVAQLGGRLWPLKINHNVLQRYSAIARINMFQIERTLGQYHMMVLMLWLMLCETDPKLERATLDKWLDDMPVTEAMGFVAENVGLAVAAAFPRAEDDGGNENVSGEPDEDPTLTGETTSTKA